MFNLLCDCNTVEEIVAMKGRHYPNMKQVDINVLQELNDHVQYPAARCAMEVVAYMYHRSSSQTVEAMNNANRRMRVRASVDVLNATILLMKMESERFERMKEYASSNVGLLTKKGSQLRSEVLQKAGEKYENFRVGVTLLENEEPPHYECVVRGATKMWTVEIACVDDDGFYENSCTCGVVEKDGVPCMHVMAIVKSKLIPHLTPTNVMPHCWSSAIWKKQFPSTATNSCNIDMEYLKMKYTGNDNLRYMPDFVGKNKRGRPKANARFKSALEKALTKKKGGKKRKRAEDDDGLGPDDVEFGFGVSDGKEQVDGEEGEV